MSSAQRSSKTCEICIKLFQSLGFGKHLGNCLYGDRGAQLLKGFIFDDSLFGVGFFWASQSIDAKSISSRLEGMAWPLCNLYSNAEQNRPQESFYSNNVFPHIPQNGGIQIVL